MQFLLEYLDPVRAYRNSMKKEEEEKEHLRLKRLEFIKTDLTYAGRSGPGYIECIDVRTMEISCKVVELEFKICQDILGLAPLFKVRVSISYWPDGNGSIDIMAKRIGSTHLRHYYARKGIDLSFLRMDENSDELTCLLSKIDKFLRSFTSIDPCERSLAIEAIGMCLKLITRHRILFSFYW